MSFARFKYWFTNVFWYHYKWMTLGALFAVGIIVLLLVTVYGQKEPDISYLLVKEGYFADDAGAEIDVILYEVVGDINGDAVPYYEAQTYDFRQGSGMDANEVMATVTRFAGMLASHDASLIFFAEGLMDAYQDQVSYLDLQSYGIDTGTDNPYWLEVTSHPAIQSAGFGETRVFAAVLGMQRNKDDPSELYIHQKMALDVLQVMKDAL